MKKKTPTIMALAAVLCFGADAWAQEARTAQMPDATLREMVTGPAEADQNRSAVLEFLARDDVRETAEGSGIDVERVEDAALALDADAAADLAERLADTEQQLAQIGGDTLVISF